jgi:arginase
MIDDVLNATDPDQVLRYHIYFDLDVLDPMIANPTGTPVPGGLSLEERLEIVTILEKTGRLQLFEVVEVNPGLKQNDKQRRDTGNLDQVTHTKRNSC